MKDRKYFIDIILEKEKQHNKNMRSSYSERLSKLPRGTLVIRELKGRAYIIEDIDIFIAARKEYV